jgi:hypothetical protein
MPNKNKMRKVITPITRMIDGKTKEGNLINNL